VLCVPYGCWEQDDVPRADYDNGDRLWSRA